MVKPLIPFLLITAVITSCSTLKPMNSGNNQVATPVASKTNTKGNDIKFLDDISVTAGKSESKNKKEGLELDNENSAKRYAEANENSSKRYAAANAADSRYSVEKASALQIKYAILLNTEIELLQNADLLEHIDEWYGTRYKMGGTDKKGIDCSAFVQVIYFTAFAVSLPRTARDQYKSSRIISSTELQEGDLVFFNTRGGISHVGIYLQNNKFVHASSSNGVIISDMFEPYYLKRYIGAGRVGKPGAKLR
jgi:lipoprotein Spr